MAIKRIFACALAILAGIAFAEEPLLEEKERNVPPPPVVSGLSATLVDNVITLTWSPAEGLDGECVILRLDRPITASSCAQAERRGVVPVSVHTFSDVIDAGKEYYYAVLSKDSTGNEYAFFIPASNALLVPVSWGTRPKASEIAAITGFGAILKDDTVIMTWNASIKGKNLILYRSTAPFTGITSLPQSVVLSSSTDISVPFVDYPVPGVSYYYAVLDEDSLRSGNVVFTAGGNTNGVPVEVPSTYAKLKRSKLTVLRPMPLPYLNPSREVAPEKRRFSRSTEDAISSLVRGGGAIEPRKRVPYVFRADLESTSGGEEYTLKQIIEGNFRKASWDEAIVALQGFLSIRRSADTAARAHFYLGEAYSFSGKPRQGVLEFLLSQDRYYNQSREWIQYVLDDMVASPGSANLSQ